MNCEGATSLNGLELIAPAGNYQELLDNGPLNKYTCLWIGKSGCDIRPQAGHSSRVNEWKLRSSNRWGHSAGEQMHSTDSCYLERTLLSMHAKLGDYSLTSMQKSWAGVDGGDGAHALVDDGIANGVAGVGTPEGFTNDGVHIVTG